MIKLYKNNRKTICYIKQVANGFRVCTGKPSDSSCLSWYYDNITDAERTANEYFLNYINK